MEDTNRSDKIKKGNRDGITERRHSSIPSVAPASAVFPSKINTRIPIPMRICFAYPFLCTENHLTRIYATHIRPIHILLHRGGSMKAVQIFEKLMDTADLPGEPLPGQCVVELAGDCRVLIENHEGVTQYSPEKIGVRVNYGTVCISGCDLNLKQMTKERLVIAGKIDCVSLLRGGKV